MANKIKWDEAMNSYLKLNIQQGYLVVSLKLGVSQAACKRQAQKMGLSYRAIVKMNATPEKSRKESKQLPKFDPAIHVIKNSNVSGKSGIWIPSERMTIYLSPNADPETVVNRFLNRHKNF